MSSERLAWATDTHLDFCTEEVAYAGLIAPTLAAGAEGLLLTGDIADARSLARWLSWLADALEGRPLYFVLGNHDYYHGSLAGSRAIAAAAPPPARWLESGGIVPLDTHGRSILVGHGGWGDTRLGDFLLTPVRLNDHRLIQDLTIPDRRVLQQRLHQLGDKAAASLRTSLREAVEAGAERVLVATHVPPFREACWHAGQQPASDSPWLPDFTCGATGEVLREAARNHPEVSFVVLCGHSHGAGSHREMENLLVHTGGAEYGAPGLAGLLDARTLRLDPS